MPQPLPRADRPCGRGLGCAPSRCCRSDLALGLAAAAGASASASASPCWLGAFAPFREDCCNTSRFGPRGNPTCWDDTFYYERCCSEGKEGTWQSHWSAGDASSHSPLLLEDAVEAARAESLFETILVLRQGSAQIVNVSKAEVAASGRVRFDFETQRRQARRLPSSAPVRIFVHTVPPCAGEGLIQDFLTDAAEFRGSSWGEFVLQQAQHLHALHNAVMRSGAVVEDPLSATVFYVPAFWSLLIEESVILSSLRDPIHGTVSVAETETRQHIERKLLSDLLAGITPGDCLTMTFEWLRQTDVFHRNAAYDHFWVAGIQHPFNPIPLWAAQIENFEPFAKNMMFLAAGLREHGFSDWLFDWNAPLYAGLKHIFVPYSTTVHCRLLEALAMSPRRRPIAVAFTGSRSSRIRNWAAEVAEEAAIAADNRIVLLFADAAQVRAASLRGDDDRAAVASVFAASGGRATNFTLLYQRADFCLVLPGHLHDLTKRCYDAMAQGCLPVVVTKPRFWMALPFAAQDGSHGRGSWRDFATFRRAGSKRELRQIIGQLVLRHESDQEGIRRQRLALSRAHGLFASHDPQGCTAAERASFPAKVLEELRARQEVWPYISSSWLFENE